MPAASSGHTTIHIKQVHYDDDYFKVNVKYRCYSEDKHDPEDGELKVSVSQKHAWYEGSDAADCDGYWHHQWVYAHNTEHDVSLKSGKLWVDAVVEGTDHHSDSDHKVYKIKFHDHH